MTPPAVSHVLVGVLVFIVCCLITVVFTATAQLVFTVFDQHGWLPWSLGWMLAFSLLAWFLDNIN